MTQKKADMIWLLAALLSTAYGQACVCSVQGAYPTNWTGGIYKKPNGCVIGDKYTMPHSYPHVQLCNACVADACACCRGTDNNFMRGINPLDAVASTSGAAFDPLIVLYVFSPVLAPFAIAALMIVAGCIGYTPYILYLLGCCSCCCRKKPELDLREPVVLEQVVVKK